MADKKVFGGHEIKVGTNDTTYIDAEGGGWRVIRSPGKTTVETPFDLLKIDLDDEVVLAIIALRMHEDAAVREAVMHLAFEAKPDPDIDDSDIDDEDEDERTALELESEDE